MANKKGIGLGILSSRRDLSINLTSPHTSHVLKITSAFLLNWESLHCWCKISIRILKIKFFLHFTWLLTELKISLQAAEHVFLFLFSMFYIKASGLAFSFILDGIFTSALIIVGTKLRSTLRKISLDKRKYGKRKEKHFSQSNISTRKRLNFQTNCSEFMSWCIFVAQRAALTLFWLY